MHSETKIHKYQKAILDRMSMVESIRFNDLIIEELESEHMNYHLKKLINVGFVAKFNNTYSLTDSGKHYINLLDDETKIIEKQPKVSVLLYGVRKNKQSGEIEFLLNRRLEQPYLGKVGRIGGKVKFGESYADAARRELYEETGLHVHNLTLEKIYRKMRKRENGEFIQDVIFYIFFATDFEGELITRKQSQENFWASKKEILENPHTYDLYDDSDFDERLEPLPLRIEESIKFIEKF